MSKIEIDRIIEFMNRTKPIEYGDPHISLDRIKELDSLILPEIADTQELMSICEFPIKQKWNFCFFMRISRSFNKFPGFFRIFGVSRIFAKNHSFFVVFL